MSVLKYNSVRYGSREKGGVDIPNSVNSPKPSRQQIGEASPTEQNIKCEKKNPEPRFSPEELLAKRETELIFAEREIQRRQEELAALKEQYISQGKEVILEAKRRAEALTEASRKEAEEIIAKAKGDRDDIYIKARAEGFEQGKKDGVAACMQAGQSILGEAKEFSERINERKAELFEQYEKDIFDTVMDIANKVTLNSMSVKDGTAAKKLIKKAAKEFGSSDHIRITLDENGASAEFAGDYEYLKELCGGVPHVEVELIPDAEPGTVIVDNGEEITDAGINTQLKMIRELGEGKFRGEIRKKRSRRKTEEAEKTVDEQPADGEE